MIRSMLKTFIVLTGLGVTALVLYILMAGQHLHSFAYSSYDRYTPDRYDLPYDRQYEDQNLYDRRHQDFDYDRYYEQYPRWDRYDLDRWHVDHVPYGQTTICLKHKVTFDHYRGQYRYDYRISYNGSTKVLFRWDVLDRMKSDNPENSVILELDRCYPHTFTMWSYEPPVMREGMIQLYNNRNHYSYDWNYWRANHTAVQHGPVPGSYSDQYWPYGRVQGVSAEVVPAPKIKK